MAPLKNEATCKRFYFLINKLIVNANLWFYFNIFGKPISLRFYKNVYSFEINYRS